MPVTAGQVMDTSAALLNDAAKVTYTYAKQLPYLRVAYQEVQNKYAALGHQAVSEISAEELIVAGATEIVNISGSLSRDIMVEPVRVYERAVGGNEDDWEPMRYLPWEDLREPSDTLDSWSWRRGVVKLTPATTDREVKVYYRRVLGVIVDQTTNIEFPAFRTYLEYRTAALQAALVMKDMARAQVLDAQASSEKIIAEGSAVKIMQNHPVRSRSRFFRR